MEDNHVSTDTRTLQKGDIFFALKGPHFDGHDFLETAVEKGASTLVIEASSKIHPDWRKKARIIEVPDTLKAYGEHAARHRRKFKIPVVAVTGSCGKTTVKELIAHVLSRKFNVLKNHGTENNLVGVPKTLLKLDASHEAAVLELGTNRPGEIATLSAMVRPQIAVVTRIGKAHLEGLGSLEGIKTEKLSIANSLERGGLLVLNGEDPELMGVTSSAHRALPVSLSSASADKNLFEAPLLGRHNIVNVHLAVAVARELGMDDATIRKALADFRPPAGRLSLRRIEGIDFIDDSYNANPTSFGAALEVLGTFKTRGRKAIVCGDMLELGSESESCHRELGRAIAALAPDFAVAVGGWSRAVADEALQRGYRPERLRAVQDSEEAGSVLRSWVRAGDCVLVKGSRGMKMEKIFECFTTSSIR